MTDNSSLPITYIAFDGFGRITAVSVSEDRPVTESELTQIVNFVQQRNLAIHVQDDPSGVITLADRAKALEAATKG